MLAYVEKAKPQDVGHLLTKLTATILEIKENHTESKNHLILIDIAHLIEIIFYNYLIT